MHLWCGKVAWTRPGSGLVTVAVLFSIMWVIIPRGRGLVKQKLGLFPDLQGTHAIPNDDVSHRASDVARSLTQNLVLKLVHDLLRAQPILNREEVDIGKGGEDGLDSLFHAPSIASGSARSTVEACFLCKL